MKTVTNGFKEELTKLGREIDFKFLLHTNDKLITENGNFLMTESNQHLIVEQFNDTEVDEVINADEIYNVSIINRGNILSTMMKELDFEIKNDLRIGDVIECEFGVKVEGTYEYINYGKYMVYSKEFNEDTKTYSYVAFDRMLLTMQEASKDFLTYLEGQTLAFTIHKICEEVGLSYTATQEELTEYPNLSKQINEGTFTDMQITYRDILDQICQALGLSMIVESKILKLKPLTDNSSYYVPYEIEGNTIQDGTPTPTDPVAIQNVTGEITHNNKTINLGNIELCKIDTYQDKIKKSTGKNLFDKNNADLINSYFSYSNMGQLIENNDNRTLIIECEPNTTYTVSKVASQRFRIGSNSSRITSGQVNTSVYGNTSTTNLTITTGENDTYLYVYYYTNSSAETLTEQQILDTIMINKGSTALPYEPYGTNWYIHKEIGKIVLNGSESYTLVNTVDNNPMYRTTNSIFNNLPNNSTNYITNYFTVNTASYNTSTIGSYVTNNQFRMRIPSTITNINTWLSSNNVLIYYALAMPTNTVITDTTLINQLEDAEIVTNTIDERYIKDTNVSFGEKYMINSVVLSRSEDTDNIYRRDEESIAEHGVHEFKIKDNLIMLYDDRENYIDEIFDQLNGLEYYINDYSSTGITYLDWLDFYNVKIGDKTYKCLMLNDEINISQGLEENIYAEEPEETVTDYKTSSKTDKEVSFIVDKQNGSIKAKVSKGEVINEINLDESGAEINADKISLAGKTIEMTSDNIAINSTNFQVDKDGNITANKGTFKGTLNTAEDCTVGRNLYVGQNQQSTNEYERFIKLTNGTYLRRYRNTTLPQPYEILDLTSNVIQINTTSSSGSVNSNPFYSNGSNTTVRSNANYISIDTSGISMSTQPYWPSDKTLKQQIKNIDTSWIDELEIKEFEYINTPDKKQIGLIAQDYEDKKYAKYFLNIDCDGNYGIAYGNITNALIQYCQEMKKEINSLKEEIKQLKESDK